MIAPPFPPPTASRTYPDALLSTSFSIFAHQQTLARFPIGPAPHTRLLTGVTSRHLVKLREAAVASLHYRLPPPSDQPTASLNPCRRQRLPRPPSHLSSLSGDFTPPSPSNYIRRRRSRRERPNLPDEVSRCRRDLERRPPPADRTPASGIPRLRELRKPSLRAATEFAPDTGTAALPSGRMLTCSLLFPLEFPPQTPLLPPSALTSTADQSQWQLSDNLDQLRRR